jgi:hypothetical protein
MKCRDIHKPQSQSAMQRPDPMAQQKIHNHRATQFITVYHRCQHDMGAGFAAIKRRDVIDTGVTFLIGTDIRGS